MTITSNELYGMVEDAFVRRARVYKHTNDAVGLKVLDDLLLYAQTKVRYYMLTPSDITELWRDIRASGDEAVDILTDATAAIRFAISTGVTSYADVCALVARSIAVQDQLHVQYADTDYTTRGMTQKEWLEVFLVNPWLLTLYLLKLMGFHPELLIPLVGPRKAVK